MHVYMFSPMYFQEVIDRWHYYPPPDNGSYSYPWLWFDGDPHGSWIDSTWRAKIEDQLCVPASVTVTMWGTYNAGSGNGTIYARFRNDSTAAITGRVLFVVTEDSIYYAGTNGDNWHNHVARDYLPDPGGQTITIQPADSITVSRSFTIQSAWHSDHCQILSWLQNDTPLPDSTKPIYQGTIKKINELVNIDESSIFRIPAPAIRVHPNPVHRTVQFDLDQPPGSDYSIQIFDPTGRLIKSFIGTIKTNNQTVIWNLNKTLSDGVYFFKFRTKNDIYLSKIIITK